MLVFSLPTDQASGINVGDYKLWDPVRSPYNQLGYIRGSQHGTPLYVLDQGSDHQGSWELYCNNLVGLPVGFPWVTEEAHIKTNNRLRSSFLL